METLSCIPIELTWAALPCAVELGHVSCIAHFLYLWGVLWVTPRLRDALWASPSPLDAPR